MLFFKTKPKQTKLTQKEIFQKWREVLNGFNLEIEKQKHNLMLDFAKSNTKFKVGDVIEDFGGIKICVDEIRYGVYGLSHLPEAIYEGFCILKSGKRSKKRASVYQSNALRFAENKG